MAFRTVDVAKTRQKPQASISLSDKREGGAPVCRIGLRAELLAEFAIVSKDRFDLQVGTEADSGKVRIARTRSGGIAPRMLKGGCVFDLGHVPEFGSEAFIKTPAKHALIDKDTLEIVLPFNTDEASPRALSLDERSITLTLGRGRIAHLEAMAAGAHADPAALACRMLASVIDEDKAASA